MTRQKQKGFTLIELLAVISIIMVLVAILTPTVQQALRQAQRASCQNSIKQILRGCSMYAQDVRWHRGTVPMALPNADPNTSTWWNSATGNRACLWLLIKSDYCTPAVFVCPGAKGDPAILSDGQFDFDRNNNGTVDPYEISCSYSYISMVVSPGVKLVSMYDAHPALVIIADKNPRFQVGQPPDIVFMADMEKKNSSNHNVGGSEGIGQNIGRLDESVRWADGPFGSRVATGSNAEDWIYQSKDPESDGDGLRRDDEDVFLIP